MKIIATTLLISGCLIMFVTFSDLSPFWFPSSANELAEQLEVSWKQDIELLLRNKKLPKQWTEIKEVTYDPKTASAKELIEKIKPTFPQNPDGKYRLEVDLDDWTENHQYSLMIEYRIYDISNQNLIWEFGRTLSQNR